MNSQCMIDQFEDLVDLTQLSGNLIVKNKNGQYWVFGKYLITQKNKKSPVTVSKKNTAVEHTFLQMKTAISWCVADKFGNYRMSRQLRYLDQQKQMISDNLSVETEMLKTLQDADRREILSNKVIEKRNALCYVENQLTNCVNWAKYWQIKGFIQNETARSRTR